MVPSSFRMCHRHKHRNEGFSLLSLRGVSGFTDMVNTCRARGATSSLSGRLDAEIRGSCLQVQLCSSVPFCQLPRESLAGAAWELGGGVS